MHVAPKTVSRKVKLLQDPNPNFVSIVNNGANQEPFRVVKRVQPPKLPTVGEPPMTLRAVDIHKTKKANDAKDGKVAKSAAAILKVEFDKDVFKTETAVTDYLKTNKYQDYEIGENDADNTFVAKSTTVAKGDLEHVREVLVENGVAAFVGNVKEDAVEKINKARGTDSENGNAAKPNQPGKDKGKGKNSSTDVKKDATEDEGETGEERVIKLDWWEMYQSNEETVTGVLKDGMSDGMPPGMDSIMAASTFAIKNVLTSSDEIGEKRTKLASVGAEMAEIIGTVYDLYEGANGLTRKAHTDDTRAFVEAFEAQLDGIEEPAEELTAVEELARKATNEDADEDKDGKNKGKDKTKKSVGGNEDLVAALGTVMKAALDPVTKSIKGMQSTLQATGRIAKEAKEAAQEAVTKAEEAGGRAPVRKSHDDEPDEPANKNRRDEGDDDLVNNLAGFLGVRRRA